MLALVLVPATATAITYDSTLLLENKDPSTWAIKSGDGIKATLNYNSSGTEFEFKLTAIGLVASTNYSLIYYANPWPGNNPGALLGGTWLGSDIMASGGVTGSIDLGHDLPTPPDSNMVVSHCLPPDNYSPPCYGAKIWLVLSSDYDGIEMTRWNPTSYLFETSLIAYTDTDATPSGSIATTTTIVEPVATIGLTATPTTIDFGSVEIGACSTPVVVITLSNTGNVPIKVTALTSAGFYTDCLKLNGLDASTWESATIAAGNSTTVNAKVCINTTAYSGTQTGSVSFLASFVP